MKNLMKKITENKYFKRFWLLGVVVIVAVVLLITAPWSPPTLDNDDEVVVTRPPATETPTEEDTSEDTTGEDTDPVETPTPVPDTGIYNPLTGLPVEEDISMNRPWAFSIGINYPNSIPSWGVSKADVMIEYMIEYGSTRIIALYQDVSDVDRIGGMRSFRSSGLELSTGFDAIFVHAGGRTYESESTPREDVVPTGFPTQFGTIEAQDDRWGTRLGDTLGKAYEDRYVVSGTKLVDRLPESFRAEHNEDFDQGWKFVADGTPSGGTDAEKVTVSFGFISPRSTTFTYDTDREMYSVRIDRFGKDYHDAANSEKLYFTNVIVMQMRAKTVKINPSQTHTSIDVTADNREGYYINGGKCIEINWSRSTLNDPFTFTLKDGTPLEMGAGKTYICVVHLEDGFVPVEFK